MLAEDVLKEPVLNFNPRQKITRNRLWRFYIKHLAGKECSISEPSKEN